MITYTHFCRPCRCLHIILLFLLTILAYQALREISIILSGIYWTRFEEHLSYCDTFNKKPGHNVICGKSFPSSWMPYLEKLNLTDDQIAMMTIEDDIRLLKKDPVFVTAFSDNHIDGAFRWVIPSFRQLTNETFFVYDLGLNEQNLARVQNLSYIRVRKFNFSSYPSYVRDLFQFRWKPLIMAELLQEYEAVFYADAHFVWGKRMNLSNLLEKARCIGQKCIHYNHLALMPASHSIYTHTAKGTYTYIPMDKTAANSTTMIHAAFQLVYYTRDVRSNIFKWWILCALEEDCMSPNGTKINCNKPEVPGECHRQDQSILGILLANRNNYVTSRFIVPFGHSDWG